MNSRHKLLIELAVQRQVKHYTELLESDESVSKNRYAVSMLQEYSVILENLALEVPVGGGLFVPPQKISGVQR